MTWKRAIFLAGATAAAAATALLLWLRPWRRLGVSSAPRGAPAAGQLGAAAPQWERISEAQATPESGRRVTEEPEAGVAPLSAASTTDAGLTPRRLAPEDAFAAPAWAKMAPEDAFAAPISAEMASEQAFATPIGAELIAALEPHHAPDAVSPLITEQVAIAEAEPAAESAEDEVLAGTDEAVDEAVVEPDDLLLIEGIGPRTSTVVSAAGIHSFAELAAADVEQLSDILTAAGIKTLNPATWPAQAQIAAEGRWDDLRALQERIKNGKLED